MQTQALFQVLNVSVDCPRRAELQLQAAATDWGRDFLRENMVGMERTWYDGYNRRNS